MILRRIFLILILILLVIGLLAWGYAEATANPVIRHARVAMPGWSRKAPPLHILLVSDIHVDGPDTPPARVRRMVGQINRLRPDLILIAGDFIGDKTIATHSYTVAEAIAPLAGLKAPLGRIAVLGNHDHWQKAAAARAALKAAGIEVLDNDAVRRGPLVIGGIDDAFTHHSELGATIAKMRRLRGARLLLSHSPDPFARLPGDIPLMLAGHTHCGQIVLPWVGPLATASSYGKRYACGIIRERGSTLIVGAGIGTSLLPLRIGAPPDMWLIELGPPADR
jgi:predicted MPP superfamily phosphohydrolase